MHPPYENSQPTSPDLKSRIKIEALKYWPLGVLLPIFIVISFLYFNNLLTWSRAPDFGWSVGTETGALEVVHVSGRAAATGLRAGDRFVAVNGRIVNSLGTVRHFLNREIPGQNVYDIKRGRSEYTIVVQNSPMGVGKAFINYGLTWLLGLLSFLIGAIVFYMKPGISSSQAFLLTTFTTGIFLTFTYTSRLTPDWLNLMLIIGSTFISATVFHLAAMFPAEQKWVKKRGWILVIPYCIAAALFTALIISTDIYADAPKYLLDSTEIFRGVALLFFLGSIFSAVIRTKDPLSRSRAIAVSFGVPALIVPAVQIFSGIFL